MNHVLINALNKIADYDYSSEKEKEERGEMNLHKIYYG